MAIEHQLVLTTDHVEVDHRYAGSSGPLAEHLLPGHGLPVVIRRPIDVDEHLRSRLCLGLGRTIRKPDVLADGNAARDPCHVPKERGFLARNEISLLVEDPVVRQEDLAIGCPPLASLEDGGSIRYIAPVASPDPLGRSLTRSTNPTTVVHRPERAASRRTTSRLSSTNSRRRTRSSGGYPVTASSGKSRTSAFSDSAQSIISAIRASLASRPPTKRKSCSATAITPSHFCVFVCFVVKNDFP